MDKIQNLYFERYATAQYSIETSAAKMVNESQAKRSKQRGGKTSADGSRRNVSQPSPSPYKHSSTIFVRKAAIKCKAMRRSLGGTQTGGLLRRLQPVSRRSRGGRVASDLRKSICERECESKLTFMRFQLTIYRLMANEKRIEAMVQFADPNVCLKVSR